MAKVKPSYEGVKHTGVAAGDDIAPASLAPYDTVKYSGVSTSGQPEVASNIETSVYGGTNPAEDGGYSSLQNAGGDSAPHGVGPKAPSKRPQG
jgi:hypothetical protein